MRPFLTLFAIALSLWVGTAQAQIQRGTRFIGNSSLSIGGASFIAAESLPLQGGLGGLSYSSDEESDLFEVLLAPQYGTFISDNFLLGAGLSLLALTNLDGFSSVLAFNPFARYYVNPAAAKTHFFAQAGIRYTALIEAGGESFFGIDAGAGLTHFLAPGLGLDVHLVYNVSDVSERGTGAIGLFTGLNILLGDDLRSNRRTAVSGIGRGTLMIGGTSGGIRINTGQFTKATSIDIAPKVLYFLHDRWAFGAGLNFNYLGGESFTNFTITSLNLSPQVRYYLAQGRHQLWFIGAGMELGLQTIKVSADAFNRSNFGFGVGAGLNSFLTPNIALELGPNLQYRVVRDDFTDSNALRLGLNVGLQFFLNKND